MRQPTRRAARSSQRGEGRASAARSDPHPFAFPIASLSDAQALSQREREGLSPLFRRRRGVGGGDQMPLPAGRRQELAGLLLACAFARDPGGVASGFQNGFSVEEHLHFSPQSTTPPSFVILRAAKRNRETQRPRTRSVQAG